jgi:hypothetical protein
MRRATGTPTLPFDRLPSAALAAPLPPLELDPAFLVLPKTSTGPPRRGRGLARWSAQEPNCRWTGN